MARQINLLYVCSILMHAFKDIDSSEPWQVPDAEDLVRLELQQEFTKKWDGPNIYLESHGGLEYEDSKFYDKIRQCTEDWRREGGSWCMNGGRCIPLDPTTYMPMTVKHARNSYNGHKKIRIGCRCKPGFQPDPLCSVPTRPCDRENQVGYTEMPGYGMSGGDLVATTGEECRKSCKYSCTWDSSTKMCSAHSYLESGLVINPDQTFIYKYQRSLCGTGTCQATDTAPYYKCTCAQGTYGVNCEMMGKKVVVTPPPEVEVREYSVAAVRSQSQPDDLIVKELRDVVDRKWQGPVLRMRLPVEEPKEKIIDPCLKSWTNPGMDVHHKPCVNGGLCLWLNHKTQTPMTFAESRVAVGLLGSKYDTLDMACYCPKGKYSGLLCFYHDACHQATWEENPGFKRMDNTNLKLSFDVKLRECQESCLANEECQGIEYFYNLHGPNRCGEILENVEQMMKDSTHLDPDWTILELKDGSACVNGRCESTIAEPYYSCDCTGTGFWGVNCELTAQGAATLSPLPLGAATLSTLPVHSNTENRTTESLPSMSATQTFIFEVTRSRNPCRDTPCLNNATCIPLYGKNKTEIKSFYCNCSEHFSGEFCETKLHASDDDEEDWLLQQSWLPSSVKKVYRDIDAKHDLNNTKLLIVAGVVSVLVVLLCVCILKKCSSANYNEKNNMDRLIQQYQLNNPQPQYSAVIDDDSSSDEEWSSDASLLGRKRRKKGLYRR